jgi:hypothetical protein
VTTCFGWFAAEVASLPEVFLGINDNFILAAVDGALMMAGDYVDLSALQASTAASGVDILLGAREIRKTARTIICSW